MQNRAQSFKPPTSWNSGQSLQLGWVPCEVSTFIYMPIPRAVSSLFWTKKIIPACGTRQTLWVPKHGNVFFYTERVVRERTGREKRWGLVWDREVPFHKGNEGTAAQWSSVRRGEVPRSWHSTVPWECNWAWKGDVYKAPLVSKSILSLAGASGLGSHLMPLPLLCGGAMAGAAGGMSSAQERPSGTSQASVCGWLGGPVAGQPDRIEEAPPASSSIAGCLPGMSQGAWALQDHVERSLQRDGPQTLLKTKWEHRCSGNKMCSAKLAKQKNPAINLGTVSHYTVVSFFKKYLHTPVQHGLATKTQTFD